MQLWPARSKSLWPARSKTWTCGRLEAGANRALKPSAKKDAAVISGGILKEGAIVRNRRRSRRRRW
jgi:hypothetical protein